jgi:hypothetical protein
VTEHDLWTPCSPGDAGGVVKGWMDIEPEKLLEAKVDMVSRVSPPLSHKHTSHTHTHSLAHTLSHTQHDTLRALEHTKPTVNKDDLDEIEKFTKEFGQES